MRHKIFLVGAVVLVFFGIAFVRIMDVSQATGTCHVFYVEDPTERSYATASPRAARVNEKVHLRGSGGGLGRPHKIGRVELFVQKPNGQMFAHAIKETGVMGIDFKPNCGGLWKLTAVAYEWFYGTDETGDTCKIYRPLYDKNNSHVISFNVVGNPRCPSGPGGDDDDDDPECLIDSDCGSVRCDACTKMFSVECGQACYSPNCHKGQCLDETGFIAGCPPSECGIGDDDDDDDDDDDSDDDGADLEALCAARDAAKEVKVGAYEDYKSSKEDAWGGYQSAKTDARSTYGDQVTEARSVYSADKEAAQEAYYVDAKDEARSEYDQSKQEVRSAYDEAKTSAFSDYSAVKENYNEARQVSSEAWETYKQDRTEENYSAYLEARANVESAKEERTTAYEEYNEARTEAKSNFAQARDDARSTYTAQREEAREVYEEARDDIKSTYNQSKTDSRSQYDQTKTEARSEYEDIKTAAYDSYLDAKAAYESAKKAYNDARNSQ